MIGWLRFLWDWTGEPAWTYAEGLCVHDLAISASTITGLSVGVDTVTGLSISADTVTGLALEAC